VTQPGVGTNRFGYSANDPVNLRDPGGNSVEQLNPIERFVQGVIDHVAVGVSRLISRDTYTASNLNSALRNTIPGANASNDAFVAAAQGRYADATLSTIGMLGEVGLTTTTFGAASTYSPYGSTISRELAGFVPTTAAVTRNFRLGTVRERANAARLAEQYPGASVQNQVYLRDANGKIVKNPITGSGRRLDHVIIENGSVRTIRETTSMTANKALQQAHEAAVRAAGGVFVRDRISGNLINVSDIPTLLDRIP